MSRFDVERCISRSTLQGSRTVTGRRRRRALVLLEVVVSLGILLVTIAVVGLVFRNGQQRIETSEKLSRGMIMAERLIAEIDTNSGLLNLDDPEQSDYFRADETIAGMSWKIKVEPVQAVEGLLQIDVGIFIGDPEDDELHENVLTTRIYRAQPRGIDLENDFGLDEDQITQISDAIPGGSQLIDPNNFDPKALASLDIDTLIELLPTLIAAFGDQFAGGQMAAIIEKVQSGDLSGLQQLGGQLGGQVGGGGLGGLPQLGGGSANDGGGAPGGDAGGQGQQPGRRRRTLGGQQNSGGGSGDPGDSGGQNADQENTNGRRGSRGGKSGGRG